MRRIPTTTLKYFSGLDLGGPSEFTALATLEQATTNYHDGKRPVATYALRLLERFPLGTTYEEVAARLRTLFAEEPLRDSELAVDFTGVGRPVLNLLKKSGIQATFWPITLTAGHAVQQDPRGGKLVPKLELVSVMQLLLQGRRVRLASRLEWSETLVQELTTFQVKVKVATDDAGLSWRERPHDDLVLAIAAAAWIAEGAVRFRVGAIL